jgi:hypothetical protein
MLQDEDLEDDRLLKILEEATEDDKARGFMMVSGDHLWSTFQLVQRFRCCNDNH